VATGVRMAFVGGAPAFSMPDLAPVGTGALLIDVAIGALVGLAAVGVTRLVYLVEDGFDHLPIHWMWWPAIGALAVGACGYLVPQTLGVGYSNIDDILGASITGRALLVLCLFKFISWCISLGSGTSGGTLAPLFTIGGGMGGLLGALAAELFPSAGVDPRIAALVGMAAMFTGASRAMLTSVVFAFETTRQPLGLLPLLGGCTAAYLVSCLLMRNTIMTEKIVRRGVRVPSEYVADFLEQVMAGAAASKPPVTLQATQTVGEVRAWLLGNGSEARHQGFPVVDADGDLAGLLTRRDLLDPALVESAPLRTLLRGAAVLVFEDSTLREAADLMVQAGVGRLPVVSRQHPRKPTGVLSRSDLLAAHGRRLRELDEPSTHLPLLRRR
jgi:CIC family chloride channel protein